MALLALKEEVGTSTAEKCVVDALAAAGFRNSEGWFYPTGDRNRAAVRVRVEDGTFELWRRRSLRSGWMMILRTGAQDFDRTSFNVWRRAWPLTH